MMSLSTIRDYADKATRKARREKLAPAVPKPADLAALRRGERGSFRIPFVGDYVAPGWKLETTHFIDMSGLGADNEPAMTLARFLKHVAANPGRGFGLLEHGQFQGHIGEFKRIGLSRSDLEGDDCA